MGASDDVFLQGMGALGAGLSGVGGIEGQRQQILQRMQAQAAMERLQKEAELKQQAEDNARAYAETQTRRIQQEWLSRHGVGNELPSPGQPGLGANADVLHAALNPAPAQMRQAAESGGGDYRSDAASLLALDPKAAIDAIMRGREQDLESGLSASPKFHQYQAESQSRIGDNNASAGAQRESGYASHQLGLLRGQQTRKESTAADWEDENQRAKNATLWSLSNQRDSAAGLSDSKTQTEDQTRPKEVAKLDAEITNLEKVGGLTDQKVEESKARVRNRDDLTAAEKSYYEEKIDALGFQEQLAKTRGENDTTRANAYASQKRAQEGTETERQKKLQAETGVVGALARAKEAALGATERLTNAKTRKAEIDADWQQTEEEQNYQRRLAQIDQTRQQYELTKNRTLTEQERRSAAKETKGLVDARIKNLEARTGTANAQTAMLKAQSAKIAYLLANPGMDEVRDLSRALMRQSTDPKATPRDRGAATQQLMQLLDQIPGFDVTPGEDKPGYFGTSFGAEKGRPSINYTPQKLQTLKLLENAGAPGQLYSNDE